MTGARFVVLALFGAVAVACHKEPRVGDDCKPTDIRCVDPKTELACQKGVFISTPCKGPMGCREDAKRLTCDTTGNLEGDPCSTEEEGAAQCIGDKQRITCRAGRYTIDNCRGDEGCASTSGTLHCDQSKSEENDPCRGATNACATDGKRVLACHEGKFKTTASCPGESGCTIVDRQVSCDLGKKEEEKKGGKPP